MVRISKQNQKRNKSPRRRALPTEKTGPKKDNLPLGYKEHVNALEGDLASKFFIPKIS
jgi:hypothetical protein